MMISELARLWAAYAKSRDRESRDQLLLHYLPLVGQTLKHLVAKMGIVFPAHLEYEDLLGYGVIGLMEALDRFDPGRGAKFEAYARLRIRGETLDALRSMDPISRSSRQKAKEIRSRRSEMQCELGRPPTDDELARRMDVSKPRLRRVLGQAQVVTISLDQSLRPDDGGSSVTLGDMLSDDSMPPPAVRAEEKESYERLAHTIGTLSERQRRLIYLYYEEKLRMREIAQILGISESRVSQLHSAAIRELRVSMKDEVGQDLDPGGGQRRGGEDDGSLGVRFSTLSAPLTDDKGQGMAEYALIIALIAIPCIAALGVFGSTLGDLYDRIASELPSGVP